MRLDFELLLPDAPGELAPVLRAVADHGGNIQSIMHLHERAEGDQVPVLFTVEMQESDTLKLLDTLTRSHRLLRVNHEGGPVGTTVLLSGHVFQARIDRLLDPLFDLGARVERIDARVAGRDKPSAVLVRLSADDKAAMGAAMDALRKRADKDGLTVMASVEESA